MNLIITKIKDDKLHFGSDSSEAGPKLGSHTGLSVNSEDEYDGNPAWVVEGLKAKAHGYYHYSEDNYMVVSSAKSLPYQEFDDWHALFDTNKGHLLADNLESDAAGKYWYLVPKKSFASQVTDDDGNYYKFLGSDTEEISNKVKEQVAGKVLIHKVGDKLEADDTVGLLVDEDGDEFVTVKNSDGSVGSAASEEACRDDFQIFPTDLEQDNTHLEDMVTLGRATLLDKDEYAKLKPYIEAVGQYINNEVTFETQGKQIVGFLVDKSKDNQNVWYLVDEPNTRERDYSPASLKNEEEVFPRIGKGRFKEVPAWQAEVISTYEKPVIAEAIEEADPAELVDNEEQVDEPEELMDKEVVTEAEEIPFETLRAAVKEVIAKSEEETKTYNKKRSKMLKEDLDMWGVAKTSATTLGERAKHGMAVGAATEGANYAYETVCDMLHNQFGIAKETLSKPANKELIMLISVALLHMGSDIFDEQIPGMDKVRAGCELVVEGKAKDNFTQLLRIAVPFLMQAKDLMDPNTAMKRIMITNPDKFKVAAPAPEPEKVIEPEPEAEEIEIEVTLPAEFA